MSDSDRNVLIVKTFGGFTMEWNGKSVIGKSKTKESQFTYLMQQIIHNGREGVKRETLESVLFADREIENTYHAIQSIIYNAKKKMRDVGMPDVNYILQKNGMFYWNPDIEVREDAAEFEKLYRQANASKDLDEKKSLYVEAAHIYAGEFMPSMAGFVWASREAIRYRGIFCSCVESAAALLRADGDYMMMEELGTYASHVQPLSDWENLTMEALVALGKFDDARKLYQDTNDYYFVEQGLKPSEKLLAMLNSLAGKMNHSYEMLDTIQKQLMEDSAEHRGGYLCAFPVFQGIYHMVSRMMERGGQSVYLMLCTIMDKNGNPMKESAELNELSQRLGDAICGTVRHGDAVNKYGPGQYLVLLVNTSRENCNVVQKRINQRFIVGRQRQGIQYYVNSVICDPDGVI